MRAERAFIGVDWGTSNARFLLVDDAGNLIEQRGGPGIGQIAGRERIEEICFDSIGEWLIHSPSLPVIMAGMVGSNIGWHLADYAKTPAKLDEIVNGIKQFQSRGHDFYIAPGLSTQRSDGLPDVMRGEEIQIFGVSRGQDALFCLPGTHSKWAACSGDTITEFHTALTGELLDLIGRNSILLNPKRPVRAEADHDFQHGILTAKDTALGLESLLFTVRSRQISGEIHDGQSENYLAGLAIGCEIRSATMLYGAHQMITLVGSPDLTALYAAGLDCFGAQTEQVSGDIASQAGLFKLYQSM